MTVFSFHISVCLQKLRGFAKGRVHGVSSTLKVDHPLESVIRSRWHLVSMLGMIRASGDTRSIVVPRENCTSFPFRFMPLCLEFRIFKAYKHLLVGKKQSVRSLQMVLHLFPLNFGRSAETLLPLKRRELSPRDTLQALLDLLDVGFIRFHGWLVTCMSSSDAC